MANKEFDLDQYLQYNLQEQAQMREDLLLLNTIKNDLGYLMLEHEIKLVNQYISTVKNNNYTLSKKNLSRLTAIINNIQTRKLQAQSKAQQNDLFEQN